MSNKELKAVARNGSITISGTVQVPNPSYKAALSASTTRDGDLNLNITSSGGIAIQVIAYRDVSITIKDDGQERLSVKHQRNGQTYNTSYLTVDR